EPHAPREPGCAGAEAVVPAAARVELADQVKQVRGGSLDMRRQLGDLVAQPIQLRDGLRCGAKVECDGVHRRFSFGSAPTLHPGFRASVEPPGWTTARRSMIFRWAPGQVG